MSRLAYKLAGVFLFAFSCGAFANTDMPRATDSLSFIPTLASLVVVVIAIFALAYIAKRLNIGVGGNRAIKVVSALSLGTRERILVIEVGGKQHLIGVTAQQVNHLFELEQPLDESSSDIGQFANQFGDKRPLVFQDLLKGFKNKKGPNE